MTKLRHSELQEDIHRRLHRLIDRVTVIRAMSTRLALLALAELHMSHNCTAATPGPSYAEQFDTVYANFESAITITTGSAMIEGVDEADLRWLRGVIAGLENEKAALRRALSESQNLQTAVSTGIQTNDFIKIQRFIEMSSGEMYDAVTTIIAALWADLDARRTASAERAANAQKLVMESVAEILDVATGVRLISLNAAVEAARVGNQGRGFSVIASEIKNLAEKIQKTADTAAENVSSLS